MNTTIDVLMAQIKRYEKLWRLGGFHFERDREDKIVDYAAVQFQ